MNARLNGRYPVIFDFPFLQKLTIMGGALLKWDLEVLTGLPSLKELGLIGERNSISTSMTGNNINSLRVLKDMLTKIEIKFCFYVEGDFMDLADFPRLRVLDLRWTTVTGDVREICEFNFSALEVLTLPSGVYGGMGYDTCAIRGGLLELGGATFAGSTAGGSILSVRFSFFHRLLHAGYDEVRSTIKRLLACNSQHQGCCGSVCIAIASLWWGICKRDDIRLVWILCSSVLEKSNHSKNTTVIVTLRDSIKKAKSRKAAVRILEWNAEKNRFDVKLISSSESRYVDNLQVRFH